MPFLPPLALARVLPAAVGAALVAGSTFAPWSGVDDPDGWALYSWAAPVLVLLAAAMVLAAAWSSHRALLLLALAAAAAPFADAGPWAGLPDPGDLGIAGSRIGTGALMATAGVAAVVIAGLRPAASGGGRDAQLERESG